MHACTMLIHVETTFSRIIIIITVLMYRSSCVHAPNYNILGRFGTFARTTLYTPICTRTRSHNVVASAAAPVASSLLQQ